ncbi:MAG: hypothetical protein WCD38_01325 [Candidatus Tumulicola sp.]
MQLRHMRGGNQIVLSQDWTAALSDGNYPHNVRRIDLSNEFHSADEQYAAALEK